jgi:DNA-binding PadR family transcriptional regulator
MDCGGSNSSDHSYRLSKLVKMGLAESKQRWGVRWGRRGSKIYRPSELGLAVRAHLSKEPNH